MAEIEVSQQADQLELLSEILPAVITYFRKLDEDGRRKLYETVGTIFGIAPEQIRRDTPPGRANGGAERFSKDRPISPKEFLMRKQPQTDVERVACLAYYLTHYREQPHFKTLDISKLNTEAAQIKFSNPAKSVDNATSYGYLAQATKGNKQLSAPGEVFVEALPDREAARVGMANARPRRKARRPMKENG